MIKDITPGKLYQADNPEHARRLVEMIRQQGYNARLLPGEITGRWFEILETGEEGES
jgi:hypothetical protein